MASEQNVMALRKRRATIKALCTRTATYVHAVTSVTPSVRAQLTERKAKLEDYWRDYDAVQSELESLDEGEANDRACFEDSYYTLCGKIIEILSPSESPTPSLTSPSPLASGLSNASDSRANIRLPKLDLSKFTGKYEEWFSFFDGFHSIIHTNASISNVEKLQYLRGCLSGEASDVISSLEISELNYDVAWRLLKDRYNNKRVIIQTHVKAIIELPPMSKEIAITSREWQTSLTGTDPPTLKQLLDFISHKCQVLEATGKSSIGTNSKANFKHQSSCHAAVKYKCSYCNAVASVNNSQGIPVECRVLLDSGSQANFISRKLLNILGLKPQNQSVSISGVNGSVTNSSQVVNLRIHSLINSYYADISCIVTDQVTNKLPAYNLKRDNFDIPRNLKLADPNFHKAADIDILLGAEFFWELMCVGQIKALHKHPTLQKTRLGWILAGRLNNSSASTKRVQALHAIVSNAELHEQLGHFWQQEEVTNKSVFLNAEESYCEQQFLKTVSRTPQGQFVVQLPLRENMVNRLGDSREVALKRLLNLEKRLSRDPLLRERYEHFLREYESMNHMMEIDVPPSEDSTPFYLPHHGVYKNSDNLAKLRVVFDASCKSSSGLSLNDVLIVGPVVQQDLASILMRFRTFAYVFTADIVKMYRQILVAPSQTHLQRILWRDNADSSVKTYELITVTYGTSSASYLATRCLKHLAELFRTDFPVGSKHVERDFYVDDILTGADTIEDAKRIRDEIVQLLRLGAFQFSKWASNCPLLLENVDNPHLNTVAITNSTDSRILGIQWDQARDVLQFSYKTQDYSSIVNKRGILSEVAKLFDPLGLLGPMITSAKLILQEFWQAGVEWDETVPQHLHSRWMAFKQGLSKLSQIQVHRRVKFATDPQSVQIHGFCDASQRAYGACFYVRTGEGAGNYRIELLCSKSRVAPLKTITLSKLELCAAVLLAQLLNKISESFELSSSQIFLWSDSTIALNWIASPSRQWSVFVSNRPTSYRADSTPETYQAQPCGGEALRFYNAMKTTGQVASFPTRTTFQKGEQHQPQPSCSPQ
ncbi:uncharacterized protein LOC143900848 [Temnothorax americanus]|uniref:uncharacterized protein LOC143900848 n=1 Tax=Temnothorax americanus TaxID=1964332 RepID=UPI0040687ACD